MSEPASISSGIAERYATAIFELARADDAMPRVRADIDTLTQALANSDDFRHLIHSPIYSRAEQQAAIGAVADRMDLTPILGNSLRLMASKRRLFVLPQLLIQLREMIARENDEISAEVIAAQPLSEAQRGRLAETLKSSVGKDVNISMSVDESLIGGLIVKVGSRMIDTSIRSKLNALQTTMREVG